MSRKWWVEGPLDGCLCWSPFSLSLGVNPLNICRGSRQNQNRELHDKQVAKTRMLYDVQAQKAKLVLKSKNRARIWALLLASRALSEKKDEQESWPVF